MTINEYQRAALRTEHVDAEKIVERLFNLRLGEGGVLLGSLKLLGSEDYEDVKIDKLRLANGLIGLNGEAGEAIDLFKKHIFQDHELDREHLAKELGDVAWYLAITANAIGYDLKTILKMNIEKLENRYPGEGFDSERSINRRDGDV